MAFRKWKANWIFDGNSVQQKKLLVTNENGRVEALIDDDGDTGATVVEGMLSPGFVNCHCHTELSHLEGRIPEKTGLVDFVFSVVSQRKQNEDEIKNACSRAIGQMWTSGISAVGDICNTAISIEPKQNTGMLFYNFVEALGWSPSMAEQRFGDASTLFAKFSISGGPASVVPHAPYSVSEDLWNLIEPFYAGRTVSIHNQETKDEDLFFERSEGALHNMYALMKIDNTHHVASGRSSLQTVFDHLIAAKKIILVHNTFTTEKDLLYLQTKFPEAFNKLHFCICANANLYIENSVPSIDMLRKRKASIVLGTDSLASNWSLDIMSEIRTIMKHFPVIPLEEILRWATINGAGALGMNDQLGSFEVGKTPGIVQINTVTMQSFRLL